MAYIKSQIITGPFIMLDALKMKYHQARFNVLFAIADYKQRYYSNSKNARVIHTKLQDQTLITLRTEPRDKYLHLPGEFLKTGKEDHIDPLDLADKDEEVKEDECHQEPNILTNKINENKWKISSMLIKFAALIPVTTKDNIEQDRPKDVGNSAETNTSEEHIQKFTMIKPEINETSLSAAKVSVSRDVPPLRCSCNAAAQNKVAVCTQNKMERNETRTASVKGPDTGDTVASQRSAIEAILSLYDK